MRFFLIVNVIFYSSFSLGKQTASSVTNIKITVNDNTCAVTMPSKVYIGDIDYVGMNKHSPFHINVLCPVAKDISITAKAMGISDGEPEWTRLLDGVYMKIYENNDSNNSTIDLTGVTSFCDFSETTKATCELIPIVNREPRSALGEFEKLISFTVSYN